MATLLFPVSHEEEKPFRTPRSDGGDGFLPRGGSCHFCPCHGPQLGSATSWGARAAPEGRRGPARAQGMQNLGPACHNERETRGEGGLRRDEAGAHSGRSTMLSTRAKEMKAGKSNTVKNPTPARAGSLHSASKYTCLEINKPPGSSAASLAG